MNKYIITILLVLASIFSYSQKVVNRANGANTIQDARFMAQYNLYAPRYTDTTQASTGSNIGIDSCGAIIFTYDVNGYWVRKCNPKRWEEIGGEVLNLGNSNLSQTESLRTFDLNNGTLQFADLGSVVIGDAPAILSSTAKLQVRNHPRLPIVAFGNLPVDAIPIWMGQTDTITSSNLNLQTGRFAQIHRQLYVQDNGLSLLDRATSLTYLGVNAKDSVRLNTNGGDLFYVAKSSLGLTKFPGFSGRTVIQGGADAFDAVPSFLAGTSTAGTSSPNNIRARGWWSGVTSYLNIPNTADTVDNYIGFLPGGIRNGKILKWYSFYSGNMTADSAWAVYSGSSSYRSYHEGSFAIGGGNSGPTEKLEVTGRIKMVDGNQQNGYVLTSDANGVGTWQAASGSSLIFDESLVNTAGTVTLVNDADVDSTYYGNLGGKGWFDASVVDISGGAPGMVPVYQGGQLFELETISVTPAGGNMNLQFYRNGAFTAAGSDSLNWTTTGLNIKGRYQIDGASVIYQPDQSGSAFLNSIFYGSLPASLSHTTGITGQYNTGVGKLALNALTTGSSNTGLGARALQALNTGINNTAVGDGAGITITSGGANTAMGMAALPVNSTGSNNSAYGFESLRMSTASNNSAYGWRSSHENTSGADNATFGVDAGYQNLTGSRNVYVGSGAGTGVASNSNSNNTGIGYRALFGITTGIGNIALGDSAGIGVTSGFRQIIIGNNVNTPSATAANIMTIGNAIYGTGMSGTGTTSEGRIGIGGSPANSKLEITSTATADSYALSIGGSAYTVGGMLLNPSTSPAAGANGFLLGSTGTIVEAGSGNHSILASLLLFAPTITGGSATATNAATLSIVGAPSATVTGGNYAFFSQAGANRFDGTVQIGSTGAPIVAALSNTATLDFDLTAVNYQDLTITVTGAAVNDAVSISIDPASLVADVTYCATVTATDTVTIRCSRVGGGGAANPGSGTFRATVIHY